MDILVTGGAGFIGSHVLEKLQKVSEQSAEEIKVVVLDDLSNGSREHVPSGMELVVGDVRDKNMIEDVFSRHHISAVIHLAAQTMVPVSVENPILDCQVNLGGILRILEACRKWQVPHVLFSSSAAVYGDNLHIPMKESEPLCPMSPYGITKMTTEQYLRVYHELYGLDATVFRFANVYGERQGEKGEGGVVSIFCKLLSQGKPITVYGDGNQTRDFVYAGDIASAIVQALPLTGYHTINVSTGTETSVNDLVHSFERAIGHKATVNYAPSRPGDIQRSVLSNEKLRHTLHIEPVMTLEQGIARTFAWYKHQM